MHSFALVVASFCIGSTSTATRAQQPGFKDELLDHFVGRWLLEGTIAGQKAVHDVDVQWVLGHQYVRMNELSHERGAHGAAFYEATVFIGWDQKATAYTCVWLDTYGGISPASFATARRDGESIPFVFQAPGSPFHTTFTYAAKGDTWQWKLDSEEKGKLTPFARVSLKRKH